MIETRRPNWNIRTSGIPFDSIKSWEEEIRPLSTELTEKEKQSPFTKYYYRQIAMPTPENIKAAELENPLPARYAFHPEEYISIMDSPAIEEVRSGYHVFDDGIGFSIARVPQKGLTDEKVAFFTENFIPEDDLFYKCWYPGMHIKHYERGCIEDVGCGMELIYFLAGYSLSDLAGVDHYEPKTDFISFHGGSGVSWPLHDLFNHARYALQANFWRDLPDGDGRETFVTFWYGMKWENGRPTRVIPEGESVRIDQVRAQFNHSVWEYTQIGELINLFWENNH